MKKKSLQVDEVRFHGNTVFTEDDLNDMIQTQPSFWRYLFDTGFFNELMFNADLETLEAKI